MKKYRFAFLLIIALSIVGCAPLKKVQLTESYNPSDMNKYAVSGQYTVTGQAFLRQQGGGTVTCAGSHVILFPATPLLKEVISIVQQGNDIDASNIDLQDAPKGSSRKATCDAQGNFRFNNVPALDWFVFSEVSWIVGGNQQGGKLLKEIKVAHDKEVFLSDRDRVSTRLLSRILGGMLIVAEMVKD